MLVMDFIHLANAGDGDETHLLESRHVGAPPPPKHFDYGERKMTAIMLESVGERETEGRKERLQEGLSQGLCVCSHLYYLLSTKIYSPPERRRFVELLKRYGDAEEAAGGPDEITAGGPTGLQTRLST